MMFLSFQIQPTRPIHYLHLPTLMTSHFQLLWNRSTLSCVQVSDHTRAIFSESLDDWKWIIKRCRWLWKSSPKHSTVTQLRAGGRGRGEFKQSVRRKQEQVSPHVLWAERKESYVQSQLLICLFDGKASYIKNVYSHQLSVLPGFIYNVTALMFWCLYNLIFIVHAAMHESSFLSTFPQNMCFPSTLRFCQCVKYLLYTGVCWCLCVCT